MSFSRLSIFEITCNHENFTVRFTGIFYKLAQIYLTKLKNPSSNAWISIFQYSNIVTLDIWQVTFSW